MASSKYSETEKALLSTLIYSDIFDFPLTIDELWRFLVSEKKIAYQTFLDTLNRLPSTIVWKDGYYVLAGRTSLVGKRKHNNVFLAKKTALAKKAAFYLAHIPTIQFIGISGSVAMKNVTEDSDIDLFLIVKKDTLFMTRLWVLVVLEWLGLRRKRNDKKPANKICVNLFIDESRLSWPSGKRDVYTAHEIAQIVPLFQRDQCYERFLASNSWITTFRPNSQNEHALFLRSLGTIDYWVIRFFGKLIFSRPLERIASFLQKNLMKKHQTKEIVRKHILALHPNDYRLQTLELLRSKLRNFGLLTKV
ncbi:MAG TPA: nucleotidyltransferase domain-containing protein [Patescibacteria group bacterium]|nr:nucleotidyltransferase domain-containing protein [Patescibacteria group bacterium]